MPGLRQRVAELFRARRVFTAADQHEPAVAILALDEILVAHLVPDLRMPQGAAATVAGDLAAGDHRDFRRRKDIALEGHCGTPEGLKRGTLAPALLDI